MSVAAAIRRNNSRNVKINIDDVKPDYNRVRKFKTLSSKHLFKNKKYNY